MSASAPASEQRFAVLTAQAANVSITIAKFGAAAITGSSVAAIAVDPSQNVAGIGARRRGHARGLDRTSRLTSRVAAATGR